MGAGPRARAQSLGFCAEERTARERVAGQAGAMGAPPPEVPQPDDEGARASPLRSVEAEMSAGSAGGGLEEGQAPGAS